MRKNCWFLVFLLFFLAMFPTMVRAANNKVGIHILETSEIVPAAEMVNSNGGDWGYVTIVLREDDFDRVKWQGFMDECRRRHIVPIVRIATRMLSDGTWEKPDENSLQKWPEFLASLNWPVQKQIVVVFNEPNHSKEWGGELKPQEYARVLNSLIDEFKKTNSNFFILNAGFDQAAGSTADTLDEEVFLRWMRAESPEIFSKLDGWASHSYPNHGFVGSVADSGKASIKGYEWELNFLQQQGLNKALPVFITETGWPHQEGLKDGRFYDAKTVAELTGEALTVWQDDERVMAITPFVFNFPEEPFDHFSWLKKDGSAYPQVDKVLGLAKIKGEPEQIKSYKIEELVISDLLPTNYIYNGKLTIINTGQWIMGENEDFIAPIESSSSGLNLKLGQISQGQPVEPGEKAELDFVIKTGTQSAEHTISINNQKYTIYVFKPWDLKNEKVNIFKQILVRFKLWLDNLVKR